MKQVRLTGITRKGKTRVGTSGPIWNVMDGPTKVPCCQTEAVLLRSLNERDWRWVEVKGDENFLLEVL